MPTQCQVVMIPGPPGAPGAAGAPGADGANAFTLLLSGFTMPAIGGLVTVEVGSTLWMVPTEGAVPGQALSVQFAGILIVSSITDSTHVELLNPGFTGNAPAGTAIPNGARVGVAGTEGATGGIPAGVLQIANNLSDVADVPTSRTNLGLGDLAQKISPLGVVDGGTGAGTAAGARTNLGAAASGLATASGLTVSAVDKVLGRAAGPGPVEEIACTGTGRSIIGSASLAAAQTFLGVKFLSVTTQVASYLATLADDVVLVDATAGPLIIDLPAVATAIGHRMSVKKIDATANTVTVRGHLAENIDGSNTQVLTAQWDSIDFVPNATGTAWFII